MKEEIRIPDFLLELTWVDFRNGVTDPEAFRRLVAGIRGESPGRGGNASALGEIVHRLCDRRRQTAELHLFLNEKKSHPVRFCFVRGEAREQVEGLPKRLREVIALCHRVTAEM